MSDELTPGGVRARRFDVGRKGYERAQVDAFLDEVANELQHLRATLDGAAEGELAIGIDDPEALAREMHRIGEEVGAILEAARAAAEGMRARATTDAESWRSAADAEANRTRTEATEASKAARASAWDEGTRLLQAAADEVDAMIAAAKEDALFVRAEAEREALRLTGDARRDREESLRTARLEAEQMVDVARLEADGVLAAASQQAEMAQERARALEQRRAELLGELEAARAAIGELENEIESKKQELETPEEPEPTEDQRTHHTSDGGSVRIVSPTRVVPLRPVDAEEMVAEVTALRTGTAAPSQATPSTEPTPPDAATPVAPAPSEVATADAPTVEMPTVATEAVPEPAAKAVDASAAEAAPAEMPAVPQVDEADTPSIDAVETTPSAMEAEPVDDSDVAPNGADDAITSLFARLRSGDDDVVSPASDPSVGAKSATQTQTAAPVAEAAPTEPVSEPANQPADEPTAEVAAVEAVAEQMAEQVVEDGASLIPAQNAALRVVKRTLVDLQNETLEHLRTDAGWLPDESFTDRFGDAFAELADAGGAEDGAAIAAAFATDLYDAVSSSIERTRESGGGDRETAAAASKVFRSWRSDEAERRIHDAARSTSSV